MLDLRFCSELSASMPTSSRNICSPYKQILSISLIEKTIRKLTGVLGVMSSLVLKVCFVLCVRSRLNYKRESCALNVDQDLEKDTENYVCMKSPKVTKMPFSHCL